MWQIWNEENLTYYWHQPFASSYISLLRAAHNAIKRADPGAKVMRRGPDQHGLDRPGAALPSRRAQAV